MTNSISTTVVEDTKHIHDTVIMPHDSQCIQNVIIEQRHLMTVVINVH